MVVNIKGPKKYKLIVYVKQKISNYSYYIWEKIASNNSSDLSGNNTIIAIGYSHIYISGPNNYDQL